MALEKQPDGSYADPASFGPAAPNPASAPPTVSNPDPEQYIGYVSPEVRAQNAAAKKSLGINEVKQPDGSYSQAAGPYAEMRGYISPENYTPTNGSTYNYNAPTPKALGLQPPTVAGTPSTTDASKPVSAPSGMVSATPPGAVSVSGGYSTGQPTNDRYFQPTGTPKTNPAPGGVPGYTTEPLPISSGTTTQTPGSYTQPPQVSAPSMSTTGAAYTSPVAPTVAAREITADQTVEGRLNALLSKGSAYTDLQVQKSLEMQAASGRQNSTIAATAGLRAAIDSALPIAQQDAQTTATAGQSAQEANQLAKIEQFRGLISSGLSAQDAAQRSGLSAQEAYQALNLSKQNAAQDMTREQYAQGQTTARQTQAEQAALNFDAVSKSVTGNLTAADRDTFTKLSSGVQQEYQNKYTAIQSTADTIMDGPAKAKAIAALGRSTQSQLDMLSKLYNVPITWDTGISDETGAGSGNPYAAPPAAPPPPQTPTDFNPFVPIPEGQSPPAGWIANPDWSVINQSYTPRYIQG